MEKEKLIPVLLLCKRKGISRQTIYNWERKGILKLTRYGGRTFLLSSQLERIEFLGNNTNTNENGITDEGQDINNQQE